MDDGAVIDTADVAAGDSSPLTVGTGNVTAGGGSSGQLNLTVGTSTGDRGLIVGTASGYRFNATVGIGTGDDAFEFRATQPLDAGDILFSWKTDTGGTTTNVFRCVMQGDGIADYHYLQANTVATTLSVDDGTVSWTNFTAGTTASAGRSFEIAAGPGGTISGTGGLFLARGGIAGAAGESGGPATIQGGATQAAGGAGVGGVASVIGGSGGSGSGDSGPVNLSSPNPTGSGTRGAFTSTFLSHTWTTSAAAASTPWQFIAGTQHTGTIFSITDDNDDTPLTRLQLSNAGSDGTDLTVRGSLRRLFFNSTAGNVHAFSSGADFVYTGQINSGDFIVNIGASTAGTGGAHTVTAGQGQTVLGDGGGITHTTGAGGATSGDSGAYAIAAGAVTTGTRGAFSSDFLTHTFLAGAGNAAFKLDIGPAMVANDIFFQINENVGTLSTTRFEVKSTATNQTHISVHGSTRSSYILHSGTQQLARFTADGVTTTLETLVTGDILRFATSGAATTSANLEIRTGNATSTNSGNIELIVGTAGAVRGNIILDAPIVRCVTDLEIDGDLDHDGSNIGFYGVGPAPQSAAYTRNATIVEDRTLLASASATIINNNNVIAALIADFQATGLLG